MARRHKHEEHQNHEAWAIPYGDLVTLLLAFFVVMYAVSSLNEGKYRVLSDALAAAFRGAPRSIEPVQVGTKPVGRGGRSQQTGTMLRTMLQTREDEARQVPAPVDEDTSGSLELNRIARQVEEALAELVAQNLVTVRRQRQWVEIEIRTDILFASGEARVADKAVSILTRVAGIMRDLPNPLRVEGHTDTVPIRTAAYPSNWELSAARAASVVHLFMNLGIDPQRMEISGFGEYRPRADNATAAGRDQNRRVVIIVLDPALRGVAGTTGPTGQAGVGTPVAGPEPASAVTQTPGAGG